MGTAVRLFRVLRVCELRAAALGALALAPVVLAGCQAVPEGHGVSATFQRRLAGMVRHVDPRRIAATTARDLTRVVRGTGRWAGRENRWPALSRNLSRTAESLQRSVTAVPDRVYGGLWGMWERGRRDAGHLLAPATADRLDVSPQAMTTNLRSAAARLPTVLDLRRQPLPSATDRNRQTGTAPAARRESWLERVVRRLPL